MGTRLPVILTVDSTAGITEDELLPLEFGLDQNYPNPFNSVTAIRFALPEPAFTRLTVFDITGRQVASVIDDQLKAGRYTVEFDAGGLSSGIYLVRLEAESNTAFIKMALVK